MIKIVLGFCGLFVLSNQCLAQTPTPIQPRKPVQPQINNPTPVQNTKSNNIPSYCANSFRVFRGILTPAQNSLNYVQFKFPLCFTDDKEVFKISRIILKAQKIQTTENIESLLNKPVKLILIDYVMVKAGSDFELVAVDYLIKDDSE